MKIECRYIEASKGIAKDIDIHVDINIDTATEETTKDN